MERILNQLLVIPLGFMAASMDLMAGTIRQVQGALGEATNLDGTIPTLPISSGNSVGSEMAFGHHVSRRTTSTSGTAQLPTNFVIPQTENFAMYEDNNTDLSGDDIKYVSYSILFKKRDYEATLQQELEEVIDYDTDVASYGAIKIGDYLRTLGNGRTRPLPTAWVGNEPRDAGYGIQDDPNDPNQRVFSDIPQKDRKHIRFVCRVRNRLEKEKANYDRDQIDAIREVGESITDAINKIIE